MISRVELVQKIQAAFNNVKLEDGIGLWEAQGLDNYANEEELAKLRAKDERLNWENLSYQDLTQCESSLSFFDAKGMRFCLPRFLIFDLLATEIQQLQNLSAPEVVFTLTHELDSEYQLRRFSLFNSNQIKCIIEFLNHKLRNSATNENDYFDKQLKDGLTFWYTKLAY
ncbi:DUF6714 family protein [Pedobacter sp. SL55]|uniref:DUF6714 family protein n=1 Tax=Pedobacter sp. SL55 TaxID=2995161 RepID=UPI00226F0E15|nr:DUF6714 family protein [Pedobacter sp. SL55]WAC42543.1 hypothetical protein OVA16_09375 [Pedobacter sp. SL55]